jgi:hypothetical protein
MNREQKRKYMKTLQAKGFDEKKIASILSLREKFNPPNDLPEGTKVQLDIDKMKKHPDYNRLTQKYRDWVNAHISDIFTVRFDDATKTNPMLVSLEEDTTDPRWLFWTGDLKKVKE